MFRYPCPTCGKVLPLSELDVDRLVACNACGARLRVTRQMLAAATPVVEPLIPQASPPQPRQPTLPEPEKRRSSVPGARWWALFAVCVLLAAGVPVGLLWHRGEIGAASTGGPKR